MARKQKSQLTLVRNYINIIDIPSILEFLGIDYVVDQYGKELKARCPSIEHNDSNPSWSICVEKDNEFYGVHNCYSCPYKGTLISLIGDVLDIKDPTIKFLSIIGVHELDENDECDLAISTKRKKIIKPKKKVRIKLPFRYQPVCINSQNKYRSYLNERNIDDEAILKYKIGFCDTGKYKNRVIIPVYKNNVLYTFAARDIGDSPKRYLYPKNSNFKEISFPGDVDYSKKTCFVVEGIFDKLNIDNFINEDQVCIALLGSFLNEYRVNILKLYNEVIFLIEDDKGGEKLLKKAFDELSFLTKVKYAICKNGDPGDFSKQEFESTLERVKSTRVEHKISKKISYKILKKCV